VNSREVEFQCGDRLMGIEILECFPTSRDNDVRVYMNISRQKT
jgi:hypothetical protein